MLGHLDTEELDRLNRQVQLSDAVAAAKVQCARICSELLDSEAAYVDTLEVIDELFVGPLSTWSREEEAAGSASGGLSPVEAKAIFGSVGTLLTVNRDLLASLRKSHHACIGHAEPPSVPTGTPRGVHCAGELSVAMASAIADAASGPLRHYAPYVQSFGLLTEQCRRLREQRPRFATAVRVAELQPRSKGRSLQALLANPVQRLPRYRLLLLELKKHVEVLLAGGEADVGATATVEKALDQVERVTERLDRRVGDAERRARAM